LLLWFGEGWKMCCIGVAVGVEGASFNTMAGFMILFRGPCAPSQDNPFAVRVNEDTVEAAESAESMSRTRAISSENTGAAHVSCREICDCAAQDEADAQDILRATNSDIERHAICEILEKASGDGYCVRMLYLRL
jgi:hypothetical protein